MAIVEKKDGEFYASTTNGGSQTEPRVAALPSGGYVVVWESSTGADIRAQRFDASGAKVGSEIVVADSSVVNRDPEVAVTDSGDFVIAWKTHDAQSHYYIAAQRYAADGTPLGTTMAVTAPYAEYTFDTYGRPAAFALPGGGFGLAWQGGFAGTRAQIYDSAGAKVGAEIVLDTDQRMTQPLATAIGADRFVVVWQDMGDQGLIHKSQVLDSAGNRIGAEVVHGGPFTASVAALADGGFAVATIGIVDLGQTQTRSVVNVQRFDSDGAMVGAQIQAAAGGAGAPPYVRGAEIVGVAGGFIVAWHEDNGSVSLRGQLFDASGAKVNSAFQINSEAMVSESTVHDRRVDLEQLESGQIVAVWSNEAGGSASQQGIKAQHLRVTSTTGGTAGDDVLNGTSGNDIIHAFAGEDEVFGGDGADELHGGDGADMLSGDSGNDTLFGGAGGDHLVGGAGNDQYYVYASDGAFEDVIVELEGEGTDQIRTTLPSFSLAGLPEIEDLIGLAGIAFTLTGNDRDNYIQGHSAADTLEGGLGNDELVGLGGDDVMRGGLGDDTYRVEEIGDVVEENEGEGTDTIWTSLATFSLVGTQIENLSALSDTPHSFRGNAAANAIFGFDQNDLLLLQDGGDDEAYGGGGNDILYFGAALTGADVAEAGDGRDVVVLQGNYNLTLSETSLFDVESVSLQSGARTTWGDTANNFYDYDLTMADANVPAGVQLIVNAQSLRAGEDFTFDGSAESDGKFLVYGGHGVDILTGGAGVDAFFFEGIRWGADDKVDGGAGRDALVISAGSGTTRIEFAADALTSIESISLNNRFATDPTQKPSYELVLHNGNVAAGGTLIVNGSSVPGGQLVNIDGRAVEDGNLILFAGGGHDTLFGGDGADLIMGGAGADSLTGGAGADTYRYDAASDSLPGLSDLISGFESGVDRIDLSRIDATSDLFPWGSGTFTWIGGDAFSGVSGQLRTYEQDGYRWVAGDTDGDGSANIVIAFQVGTAPLVAADFLL